MFGSVGWSWFLTRRPEFAYIVRIYSCKIQFRYFNASFATKQKMCGICLDVYLRWRQLARASGGTCTPGQGQGAEALGSKEFSEKRNYLNDHEYVSQMVF